MNSPSSFRLSFYFAILFFSLAVFALAPQPALAQHGGGGHGGGGGHMGGGFGGGGFGGGGGRFGGGSGSHGSMSSGASHSSHGSSHSSAGMIVVSGNKEAASSKPAAPVAASGAIGGNTRFGGFPSLQMSGPKPSGFAGFVAAPPEPQHITIGFPPSHESTEFAGESLHLNPGAALSFSGQGHEIWQNQTSLRAAPAQAPALTAHFNARPTTSPAWMRRHSPHIGHQPIGSVPYYPVFFPGFYGFSPFLGFGWCDPFDTWSWNFGGCGLGYGWGPGYGYGGYGFGLGYGYPGFGGWDTSGSDSSDWNLGGSASDDAANAPSSSTWQAPPDANSENSQSAAAQPDTVIYLQDGTSYDVKDYWLSENKLHYVTNYGGENAVDVSRIDMQRTVDANASRGLAFSLHPAQPTQLNPPPSNDNPPPQQ